jgi:membrane-associated phospholipid phosphatase
VNASPAPSLARAISILGHPLAVLPPAVLLALAAGDPDVPLAAVALGFAGFGLLVLGWSWRQVRRGRWAHVDASGRDERGALNRFLLVAIALGATLAWWRMPTPDLALALGLAAALIVLALLGSRWCKLSLHLAFAVYAAGLLWPYGAVAVIAGLVFAAAIAWSRLRLARHVPIDLIAGALAGAGAAAAYALAADALRSAS